MLEQKNVIKYILSSDIKDILTDQGLEFLNMIKKELASDERTKQDGYFSEYKLSNEYIYQNNQNKKTKIFSSFTTFVDHQNCDSKAFLSKDLKDFKDFPAARCADYPFDPLNP